MSPSVDQSTGTAHGLTSAADAAGSPSQETPFKTSVMLWTVMTEMPFGQRLEKMAEAGYRAVELSGEYANWTDDDFRRYNQKRAALGITFDLTTTVMVAPGQARHAVADPSEREGFLAGIRSLLPIMERIECPALSVMSGNVVPGLSPQAQHDSCVEGLKRAAELVEGKDVTILAGVSVETPPGSSMTWHVRSPGSFSCARCPAVTVMLEAGGAGAYTPQAIPGSEPASIRCLRGWCDLLSAYLARWPGQGSMMLKAGSPGWSTPRI